MTFSHSNRFTRANETSGPQTWCSAPSTYDGGAGGGWQEQGFGVTASLTRSRGERPWEATGTTSIARIDKESSTTTGTLIIIIIAPLVFGPAGSLGSPVPRGERTLEGSLVDVERNGLQNTQAQYRTSLKPCARPVTSATSGKDTNQTSSRACLLYLVRQISSED